MRPLVLFDLDDTLVDRRGTLVEWVESFRVRHGLDAGAGEWLFGHLAEHGSPAHFAEVRDRFALAEPVDALWEGYRADIAAAVVCPAEVLAGLDELRAGGWRVGIATNGGTDIQRAKLRSTGIAEHVDAVCVSEEAGFPKPDPAMFHTAVRRCGGDGGSVVWMVGDNPVNDIEGGRSAGLRTVWISRGAPWPEGIREPDHQVSDARAAIDLLITHGPEGNCA